MTRHKDKMSNVEHRQQNGQQHHRFFRQNPQGNNNVQIQVIVQQPEEKQDASCMDVLKTLFKCLK